ncbi:EthD domain-containing protein [Rhizobium sp. AB2/73]|nr:EthD domain-containing protein [Rhizobium sp. AB2/73]MBO9112675.1 EthD domain-containing protein [Agrobacterium sp. S2/73]QXZ76165.1 EthD domain-containing protein [Agrobacterium sp. S7/73]
MTLLAKKDNLSLDAFRNHWAGDHAQLALSLPGVCKYTQNRAIEVLMTYPQNRGFTADGIVELFFTDEDAMMSAQASEIGAIKIPEDELQFLRGWSLNIVETSDPHDHFGSKVMVPITLRDRDAAEAARAALASAASEASATQISINTVTSSHSRPRLWSEPVAPHNILVLWFNSAEQARAAFETNSDLYHVITEVSRQASAYLCDPLVVR